jgi:hypothetical protein
MFLQQSHVLLWPAGDMVLNTGHIPLFGITYKILVTNSVRSHAGAVMKLLLG